MCGKKNASLIVVNYYSFWPKEPKINIVPRIAPWKTGTSLEPQWCAEDMLQVTANRRIGRMDFHIQGTTGGSTLQERTIFFSPPRTKIHIVTPSNWPSRWCNAIPKDDQGLSGGHGIAGFVLRLKLDYICENPLQELKNHQNLGKHHSIPGSISPNKNFVRELVQRRVTRSEGESCSCYFLFAEETNSKPLPCSKAHQKALFIWKGVKELHGRQSIIFTTNFLRIQQHCHCQVRWNLQVRHEAEKPQEKKSEFFLTHERLRLRYWKHVFFSQQKQKQMLHMQVRIKILWTTSLLRNALPSFSKDGFLS